MKIVVISGTPGCGKTSVSKKISEKIGANVISLNELAIAEDLTLKFDKKRNTHVIDVDRLVPHVINLIEEFKKNNLEFLIIESHFSDIIPEKYIDYAIVLRCDPDLLYQRLEARGYKKEKIIENVQAEILGECTNFFVEMQTKVPLFEIDSSNLSVDDVANIIINIIVKNKDKEKFQAGKIDWLEKLAQDDSLAKKYFYDVV